MYEYVNHIFRSNFSETIEVEITDISINSSGTYYCQTEDKDGQRHRDELQISVIGISVEIHWLLVFRNTKISDYCVSRLQSW